MSIFRNTKGKKPVYRNAGGYGTGTGLPGEQAQDLFEQNIAGGNSVIDTTGSYEDVIDRQLGWAADPTNIPQYYTGNTVAGLNDDQLLANQGSRDAAFQTDDITADLLGQHNDLGDPTGAFATELADATRAGQNRAWGGTGTFGSARHGRSADKAVADTLLANKRNSLDAVAGLRDDLTRGSDIMSAVGNNLNQHQQSVINEDIKRFNWAQLTPQQQMERVLALVTTKEGIRAGNIGVSAPGAGQTPWYERLLNSDAGSSLVNRGIDALFSNEGGPVYRNDGGMGMEGEMAMPQGEGIMPGEAPMDPMMMEEGAMPPMEGPQGAGIMNGMAPEGMPMEPMEEMSELDKIESTLMSAIEAGGLDVTITRKTKPKGGK